MGRARSKFTQADVTRAFAGARKAGIDVGSVEVSPDGMLRIIPAHSMPKASSLFDELEAAGKL